MSPVESIVVTPDPLLYRTPLPYRRTFYPMGFAAEIVTNCEAVLAAAESVWSRFERTRNEPAVELRLAVSESSSGERPTPRLPRGQGNLVSMIHDAENFAICDLRSGFAFGWLTPAVAADETYIRYHFVESCVYLMLEALYLVPAHAACISLAGGGLLLCGDSGAGKSTLSYFCARRGWTYITDDGTDFIRHSNSRIAVGMPYQIRFRPEAVTLFPELAGHIPFDRPRGKPSLEIDTASLNLELAQQTFVDYLVFLNRTPAAPQRLAKFDTDEAFARLSHVICYGEESLREELRKSLHRLLEMPIYELQYHDLDWAERRLRALVQDHE